MTRYVVLFSGGIASWAAARRLVDSGASDVTLLFTDTRTEDIGAPLVKIEDGRDIWQVFRDERMLGNTRIDPCSRILKRDLSKKWLAENAPDATLVFGYDWTEVHRLDRTRERWAPRPVLAPLTEPPYRLRSELIADMEARGLQAPRLYGLGFSHNNCGGGCVKAGQGHFAHLYRTLPEVYADWERNEQALRDQLGDVSILRDRTGGDTTPLTLAALRERLERSDPIDLWDIGGCACFEEAA